MEREKERAERHLHACRAPSVRSTHTQSIAWHSTRQSMAWYTAQPGIVHATCTAIRALYIAQVLRTREGEEAKTQAALQVRGIRVTSQTQSVSESLAGTDSIRVTSQTGHSDATSACLQLHVSRSVSRAARASLPSRPRPPPESPPSRPPRPPRIPIHSVPASPAASHSHAATLTARPCRLVTLSARARPPPLPPPVPSQDLRRAVASISGYFQVPARPGGRGACGRTALVAAPPRPPFLPFSASAYASSPVRVAGTCRPRRAAHAPDRGPWIE